MPTWLWITRGNPVDFFAERGPSGGGLPVGKRFLRKMPGRDTDAVPSEAAVMLAPESAT